MDEPDTKTWSPNVLHKNIVTDYERRIQKLEAALVDLLRAPYMDWYPFAINKGCHLMNHPSRWPKGSKPEFKDEQCVCGTRKP